MTQRRCPTCNRLIDLACYHAVSPGALAKKKPRGGRG